MWRRFASGPPALVPDTGQDQPHPAAGLPLLSRADAHISLPPVFTLHEVRDKSPAVSLAPFRCKREHFSHLYVCVCVCVGVVWPPEIRTVVGPEAAPVFS